MSGRSKLNSIETLTSKAWNQSWRISNNHQWRRKYRKMKEDIRMMETQRSDELDEEEKKDEINKIIKLIN